MAYGNYAPFYRGGYFNPMQPTTMPNVADNQNQFVQPYQTQMPMQTAPIPTTASNNDMIFVLGQNEAESFPVAPNATVTMWDKNQNTVYIKSVNSQGVPSMRILDFEERTSNAQKPAENHVCKCGDKFVTKEQFNDLKSEFEHIASIVDELKSKPSKKTAKGNEE